MSGFGCLDHTELQLRERGACQRPGKHQRCVPGWRGRRGHSAAVGSPKEAPPGWRTGECSPEVGAIRMATREWARSEGRRGAGGGVEGVRPSELGVEREVQVSQALAARQLDHPTRML